MAAANRMTELRSERNTLSSMRNTIADAIGDSNSDLINSDCYCTIAKMATKIPLTPQVMRLQKLVEDCGGPGPFAEKYTADPDDPINATYVSQLINGTRAFGDKARKNMARRAGLNEDYFEITRSVTEKQAKPYIQAAKAFLAEDEQEVISIMRKVDSEARRNIVAAARLAEIEFGVRHKNSNERTAT